MRSLGPRLRKLLGWCGTAGAGLAALQFAFAAFVVTVDRVTCKKEEEPPPDTLPADERPQFLGVDNALNLGKPPADLDELYGGTLRGVSGKWVGCMDEWTDDKPIFSRAGRHGGARNGVEIVFWKALTYRGKTIVGKYVADLYSWASAGTGAAGFPSGGSSTANQRLVERLPPPAPPPPGYRAIVPGECVGSSLDEGPDRVVGRFMIDLPADRSIRIFSQTPVTPLDVRLGEHLQFDGVEVPAEYENTGGSWGGEPTGRLKTAHAGRYVLVVYRTDEPGVVSPQQIRGKIYTLQVYWGTNADYACSPQSARKDLCF